jgi:hypothetical protein
VCLPITAIHLGCHQYVSLSLHHILRPGDGKR